MSSFLNPGLPLASCQKKKEKRKKKDSEETGVWRERSSAAGNGAEKARRGTERGKKGDTAPALHNNCLSNSEPCLFSDSVFARSWPQAPMVR